MRVIKLSSFYNTLFVCTNRFNHNFLYIIPFYGVTKQTRKEAALEEARLEVAYESEQAEVKLSKLKRRFIDNVQVLELVVVVVEGGPTINK
jgi:predicted membrane protein